MAIVKGFKGIRYNPERIEDFSKVLAPPYDVISPEEQETLYERSPYNVIRLDLAKGEGDSKYENAASMFRKWIDEKILIQDDDPSIYPYRQEFQWEGRTLTRKGFIAVIKIEDFSSKMILPHEMTFPKHKKDRLKLTEACRANMSPVFSVYSDPEGAIEAAIDEKIKDDPIFNASIEDGVLNSMWQISDPGLLSLIGHKMKDKSLLIADGHHRYETALEYRNMHAGTRAAEGGEVPFDYVMMFLSRGEDEGLIINPTHRVAAHLEETDLDGLLGKLGADFKVSRQPLAEALSGLGYEEIVIAGKDPESAYRLSPADGGSGNLAVMLLHTKILGKHLDEEKAGIVYTKFLDEALDMVHNGDSEIAFILPELRARDIFDVVMTGERMPHKTTYFYPKILSGLVFNPLW